MKGYRITCPECGFVGDEDRFNMSLCDECFCPNCDCDFMLDTEDHPDDEDE